MKKIDPYIHDLLYDHDCVIITDLGGFVGNYKAVSVNGKLNIATPASKKIAFNADLKHNDGLLASHISAKEAVNYADACEIIRDYVSDAREQMSGGKKVNIEKVGMLFLNGQKNLEFIPDSSVNYLRSSFGLSPVHTSVVRQAGHVQTESKPVVSKPVIREFVPAERVSEHITERTSKGRRGRGWKVAEVIPAAAMLAALIITPAALREFNTNLGTLLPFSRINEFYFEKIKGAGSPEKREIRIEYESSSPFIIPPVSKMPDKDSSVTGTDSETDSEKESVTGRSDEQAELTEESNIIPDGIATLTNSDHAEIPSVQKPDKNTDRYRSSPGNQDQNKYSANDAAEELMIFTEDNYHVIGGCFRVFENAENFVRQMRSLGADAHIIGQNGNGLYMVSLFHSGSASAVYNALPELREDFVAGAWVTKK